MTSDFFVLHASDYLLLNIGAFVAMSVLLLGIPKISQSNLVIVILLLIFAVGYFFKFYYLAYLLGTGAPEEQMVLLFGKDAAWMYLDLAFRAFETVAITFMAFAFISILLMVLSRRRNVPRSCVPPLVAEHACLPVVVGAIGLAIITGLPRYFLHLGADGQGSSTLPFHLEGVIFVLNQMAVPALIGLAIVLAMESRNQLLVRRMMLVFIGWGVLQFSLFTSKSVVIMPLLWYGLGSVVTGFHHRGLEKWFILGVVCFIMLFPFLNLYRLATNIQGTADSLGVLQEFSYLLQDLVPDLDGLVDVLWYGLSGVIRRTSGFGELIAMQVLYDNYPHAFLSYLISGQSAGVLLTHSKGFEGGTGIASSLLGQAYFATGSVWGTALWVSSWAAAAYIISLQLLSKSTPLFRALWVVAIINFTFWSVDELGFYKIEFLLVTWLMMILAYRYSHSRSIREATARISWNEE